MKRALLLIDVQKDMLEQPKPVANYQEVKKQIKTLLDRARAATGLVVHVQNDGVPGDPDEPGTKGWELVFPPEAKEPVLRKSKADAFTNQDLASLLDANGVKEIVVAGMQSNYCVLETCKGGKKKGYDMILASGAHATYDEKQSASEISKLVESELKDEGVTVVRVDEIHFE